MRRIICLILLLLALPASASTHYIRNLSVGVGNNAGTDWNNPITNWTGLSGTWIRGDTYYFAMGDYRPTSTNGTDLSKTWRLDCTENNHTYTTIIVATAADHGTDTGWLNSFTNAGVFSFYHWIFDTSDWHVKGQQGQFGTNDIDYIPFIAQCHSTNWEDGDFGTRINSGATNIFLEHIEYYCDAPARNTNFFWSQAAEAFDMRTPNGQCTNICVSIHDVSSTGAQFSAPNSLWTNCMFARNGIGQITKNFSPTDHSEPISTVGLTNTYFVNCVWEDARSSSWSFANKACSNMWFIGCVFKSTGFFTPNVDVSSTTSMIGGNDTALTDFVHIINCTFINIPYAGQVGENSSLYGPNNVFENNIVYGCIRSDGGAWSYASFGHSFNSYLQSGAQSETGLETLVSNPFVKTNSIGTNLHLTVSTSAGDPSVYPLPYNFDRYGNAFSSAARGAIAAASLIGNNNILPLNVRAFGH